MSDKKKEEKSEIPRWMFTAFLLLMIPLLIFMFKYPSVSPAVFISLWVLIPVWLHHKRTLAKQELQLQSPQNKEVQAEVSQMKERLENIEMLICNLDREINLQFERTLSSGRISTGLDAAAVSQMPTTFMNVASALQDRYQILKELGRGGMGIVFQAQDKELGEQVAIKILSPLLSNDPDAIQRLKREVSAARRVTHPNVIRIHDIAEIKGLHYVSMEYFHGENLKEYIHRNKNLSFLQAYQIALQICDGLEAAHRQGVIHRDLKSQNVIINSSNQIKIIDFGLEHTAHLKGMTATGLIMGTPEYMAPEQVAGNKVDERADIYSLGIILYELFTGRVPFSGDSAIAVGFKQIKEAPEAPCRINPQIPPEIEATILKALEKNPIRRQHSVGELKIELDASIQKASYSPMAKQADIRKEPPEKIKLN